MKARSPLERPIPVVHLPPEGRAVEIVADASERAALARDFDLHALHRLEGRFHLTPLSRGRVQVEGTVEADAVQTCVVTLDPLEVAIAEPVDATYAPEDEALTDAKEVDLSAFDPPDLIVNGAIDLGALASEFLALALDPYPRKPDAALEEAPDASSAAVSPFATLSRLKETGDG